MVAARAVTFDRRQQDVDLRLALGEPFHAPTQMRIDDQHRPATNPHVDQECLARLVVRDFGQGDAVAAVDWKAQLDGELSVIVGVRKAAGFGGECRLPPPRARIDGDFLQADNVGAQRLETSLQRGHTRRQRLTNIPQVESEHGQLHVAPIQLMLRPTCQPANRMGQFPARLEQSKHVRRKRRMPIMRFVKHAVVALLSVGTLGTGTLRAQPYPARDIKFIVAFAPGGVADTLARLVGARGWAKSSGARSWSKTAVAPAAISPPRPSRARRRTATHF